MGPFSPRLRMLTALALVLGASSQTGSSQSGRPAEPPRASSVAEVKVLPAVVPSVTYGRVVPRRAVPVDGERRQGPPVSIAAPVGARKDAVTQLQAAERSLGELSDPIEEFDGMGGSNPNDTTGDVGPNHFVQAINSSFRVYDKQGTSLEGPTPLGDLWDNGDATVDACEQDAGDPIVLYDNLADRWMISQFSRFAPFRNFMCLAVSVTADPRLSQGYYRYTFDMGAFPDYLKLGAWPDGYYFSANGDGVAMAAVFDRANMLNGNPAGAIQFGGIADLPNNSFNVLMPGDLDGATPPPPGTRNVFYRPVDGDAMGGGADRIELFEANINWGAPAMSTLSAPIAVPLAAFDMTLCGFLSFGCIPQPGGGNLDPVNETGMFRFPYRNYGTHEALAGNFTVDVDGNDSAGIRWFVLRRTGGGAWTVENQGTYAPQPADAPAFVHRFMGSLAMDRFGNLALGYTASSAQQVFASARYTGRLAGDPLGLLPQPEITIQPGTGALGAAGADTRWGDYYTMVVDPIDDCTFWYTGDYATNIRQSVIASFRFASCATDLSIAKTVSPSHPNAGEEIVYTITVHNDGPINAQNVVVTDVLPAQVAYLANTDACTGVPVGGTGTLTCTLGSIPAGTSVSFQIKARINSDLGGATAITNTASVSGEPGESDPSDNSVSLTHLVNELADVSVTKLCKPDSGPAPAGTMGTCTILVTNSGPSAARTVTLTDTHVSEGPFTLGTPVASQGACAVAASVVTCSLGTILPGATARVDVPVTSAEGVDVNDVARVSSATPDPNAANNEATAGVAFDAAADLMISKSAPASVMMSGTFVYTISVDNAGPSTAVGVVVTDTLPAGVEFVSAVASVGTFSAAGGIVTWNVGTVAVADPARTLEITVHVLPSTPASLVNNASVSSATTDPNSANNLATTTTVVVGTDLWISKTGTVSAANPAGALIYSITVHNEAGSAPDSTPTSGTGGPNAAQNVVVVDTLPLDKKKMVVQFLSPGCTYDSVAHTVTCTTASLAAGTAVTFEIQVQIKGSVGNIVNVATVTSTTPDPDASNNTDTVNNVVQGGAGRGPK